MASPYIVLMDNNLVPTGIEYFTQIQDDQAASTLDPSMAMAFSTKAKAREWVDKFIPSLCEDINIEKFSNIKVRAFEEWKKSGYRHREFSQIRPDINIPYDESAHDAIDVLKWNITTALADDDSVSFENYCSWPNLYPVFQNLHSIDCYNEYNDDGEVASQELRASIAVNPKTSKFETFEKELNLAFDAIAIAIPSQKDNDFIYNIHDDDCSEFDSYVLKRKTNGTYSVYGQRYSFGERDPEIKTKDLKKIFEHIKKRHPYSL